MYLYLGHVMAFENETEVEASPKSLNTAWELHLV